MSAASQKAVDPGVWVTDRQVQLCGNANHARFLAQCLYWSNTELVEQRQGWFYKSRTEWQAETWLSRYQQEKARQWLRDSQLLEERHERRQNGIRLWFRLDRMRYHALLNTLAEQSQQEKGEGITGDCPEVMDEGSITERLDINKTVVVDNEFVIEESKGVEEIGTIVPIQAYKSSYNGESGTIVQDNITVNNSSNSDNHCINIESTDFIDISDENAESPSVQPQTPDDLPVPGLTCRSDNGQPVEYSTTLADYQGCHPFIYQFLKTRILSGPAAHDWVLDEYRRVGFSDPRVLKGLDAFVQEWGTEIVRYYQGALSMDCPPFGQDDIDDAIWLSRSDS